MIISSRKKNKFILCVSVLVLICCQGLFAQVDNTTKVRASVDSVRLAYERVSGRKIPSLNVLIQTPVDYIFVSSVPDGGVPVTKDTHFRFASNTKNFTSAAVLNMQEDGWLNIK